MAQHNYLMQASSTPWGLFGSARYCHAGATRWRSPIPGSSASIMSNMPGRLGCRQLYGAQRRPEIARAMCTRPILLCLDEPAALAQPRESAELNSLLLDRDQDRIGILLIEHDMSVVMEISDHIVVLDYGRKIAEGHRRRPATGPRRHPRLPGRTGNR
ncbi:MAG: hypothetical protein U1F68_05815 [Gammaproteobacteria bacterium]